MINTIDVIAAFILGVLITIVVNSLTHDYDIIVVKQVPKELSK